MLNNKKIRLLTIFLLNIAFEANMYSQNNVKNFQNNNSGRWGRQIDKSNDAELRSLITETVNKFKVLKYWDEETNDTMSYNLFIPDNYDPIRNIR